MLQRIIPSSQELLPVIGIGSWIQFDIDSASAERDNLKQVLLHMQQQGARLIDSSPMYGRSEQVIGELTRQTGVADHFFYATKVWTTGREAGIQQMRESMQKMQRPVMDLMQIHNLVDWQTHLQTLRQWKNEGTIRYTGITHYTNSFHAQIEDILRKEQLDFVQFNYSIARRNAEQSLLPLCIDKGVAVLVNEPLEKADLFKKVKGIPLPAWCADYDIRTWGQFFLKYILSHPGVTCIIPGTSDPAHMLDNIAAGQGTLPDENGRKKMSAYFDGL